MLRPKQAQIQNRTNNSDCAHTAYIFPLNMLYVPLAISGVLSILKTQMLTIVFFFFLSMSLKGQKVDSQEMRKVWRWGHAFL